MKRKKVLIISNPEDEHTVRVVEHLRKRGVQPVLYYPENFGRDLFLSLTQGFGTKGSSIIFSSRQGDTIDLNDFYSIWYRRPRLVSLDEEAMEIEAIEFTRDEWKAALVLHPASKLI